MTVPTASALDTKLTLAIGQAHRNGYELPDSATIEQSASLLAAIEQRWPRLAASVGIAVDPNGAIEIVLATGTTLLTIWAEADAPLLTLVTETKGTEALGSEEELATDAVLARLESHAA